MSKISLQSLLNKPASQNSLGLVGYGIGDFGLNLFWNSLSILLIFYFVSVVKITPVVAGFVFFAGTLWDGITDPVMATVAERTKSRWGRYRPYILFGGIGLGVSFVILMAPIHSNTSTSIAFLFLAHLIFRACYTLVSVPYSALSSTITKDSRKRTILSGFRMFFAFSGGFAISAFAFPIIRTTGDGTDTSATGFFWFAVICAIAAQICFIICFFTTQEKRDPGQSPTSFKQTIKQAGISLRRNRSLHTLVAFISCQSAAGLIFGALLTFYVQTSSIGLRSIEAILTANSTIGILMLPFWTFVAHRYGKKQTWVVSSSIAIIAGFHMAVAGPVLISGFVLQIIVMAAAMSAFGVLVWSMIPDTIEYGAWKTGVKSEAATFGATLFMQKLTIGLAGLILGYLLEAIGYDSEATTVSHVVAERIGVMVGLGPAILLSVALLPLMRHPVTRLTHEAARTALAKPPQTGSKREVPDDE